MRQSNYDIFQQLILPVSIVSLMWLVKIIEVVNDFKFTRWGILPREWDGILGIFTSPFIHKDWQHLMSNSIPMLMLTSMIMVFYKKVAIQSILIITTLTGIAVWLFAHGEVYHIGASGVIYGLVAFLAWTGIFRKNIKSIILSLIILAIYHGYFYGILPTGGIVSWESHLFGAISGIFVAFLFKDMKEEDEIEHPISTNK